MSTSADDTPPASGSTRLVEHLAGTVSYANPSGIGLLALIREDYAANDSSVMEPGFQALFVHRMCNWSMTLAPTFLRTAVGRVLHLMYVFVRNVYGIELPYTAKVGRRLHLEHQSGIIVNGWVEIGDDCRIRHNVTIGVRSPNDMGMPKLGNRVDIGAGAVILGAIGIDDGATIGANAVVLIDVPVGGLAVGVPARIVSRSATQ